MSKWQTVWYRSWQFFTALGAKTHAPLTTTDRQWLDSILTTPAQRDLFFGMSANDQRHGLAVARTLQQAGQVELALLQAGLLHDVGKSLGQPIIHRVLIVLLTACWPTLLIRLSTAPPLVDHSVGRRGFSCWWWRRPFVIHAQHPAIGASWAAAAGCEPLAGRLIARHQDRVTVIWNIEDRLLLWLQWADDLN